MVQEDYKQDQQCPSTYRQGHWPEPPHDPQSLLNVTHNCAQDDTQGRKPFVQVAVSQTRNRKGTKGQ